MIAMPKKRLDQGKQLFFRQVEFAQTLYRVRLDAVITVPQGFRQRRDGSEILQLADRRDQRRAFALVRLFEKECCQRIRCTVISDPGKGIHHVQEDPFVGFAETAQQGRYG
jgi:hypothetical protein